MITSIGKENTDMYSKKTDNKWQYELLQVITSANLLSLVGSVKKNMADNKPTCYRTLFTHLL